MLVLARFGMAIAVLATMVVAPTFLPDRNHTVGHATVTVEVHQDRPVNLFREGWELRVRFGLLYDWPTEIGVAAPAGVEFLEGESLEILPAGHALSLERTYRVRAEAPGSYSFVVFASHVGSLAGVIQRHVPLGVEGSAESARLFTTRDFPRANLTLDVEPRDAKSGSMVVRVASDVTLWARVGPEFGTHDGIEFAAGSGIWEGWLEGGTSRFLAFELERGEEWGRGAGVDSPIAVTITARGDARFGPPIAIQTVGVDFRAP